MRVGSTFEHVASWKYVVVPTDDSPSETISKVLSKGFE